jgi:RNA polymerase sigma factor (sigma-70 family)
VVDEAGLIRFANASAATALGYGHASDLLGRPSHQTIQCKRPDGTAFPVQECPMLLPRTTGQEFHAEDYLVRRDGSLLPVEFWSAPIDLPDGRGAVVSFTDVSERRRTERALAERDAILSALGQPVWVVTHQGVPCRADDNPYRAARIPGVHRIFPGHHRSPACRAGADSLARASGCHVRCSASAGHQGPARRRSAAVGQLAVELDMTPEKVIEVQKYGREPISLHTPLGEDGDSEFGDLIEDSEAIQPGEAVSFTLLQEQLHAVLDTLSEREAGVVSMRFGLTDGQPKTLDEIGKVYGVTRERIRQIESKTMSKLRHTSRSDLLRDYLD